MDIVYISFSTLKYLEFFYNGMFHCGGDLTTYIDMSNYRVETVLFF